MARLASYKGVGAPAQLVEALSVTSTLLTLTDDQQGKFLTWGGQSSASRIRLPAPEAGMVYTIAFNGPGVSTATKITSSGAYDILTANTTGKGVSNETTAERGQVIQLVAINDVRWLATRQGGTTWQS